MKSNKPSGRIGRIFYGVFLAVLVSLSYLAFFSAVWCEQKYGDVGFDAVLFTLFSDMNGVADDLIFNYIKSALPPTVAMSALTLFFLLFKSRNGSIFLNIGKKIKLRIYPLKKRASAVIALILSAVLIVQASSFVGLGSWLSSLFSYGKLFEIEYVDPDTVKLTFPEKKRNLIYIYLESMENTFFSKDLGGYLITM